MEKSSSIPYHALPKMHTAQFSMTLTYRWTWANLRTQFGCMVFLFRVPTIHVEKYDICKTAEESAYRQVTLKFGQKQLHFQCEMRSSFFRSFFASKTSLVSYSKCISKPKCLHCLIFPIKTVLQLPNWDKAAQSL